jgi:hypothetical protein
MGVRKVSKEKPASEQEFEADEFAMRACCRHAEFGAAEKLIVPVSETHPSTMERWRQSDLINNDVPGPGTLQPRRPYPTVLRARRANTASNTLNHCNWGTPNRFVNTPRLLAPLPRGGLMFGITVAPICFPTPSSDRHRAGASRCFIVGPG